MINYDDITIENIKEHNLNWPWIPDDPYRILIIGDSGPGKTNALFNLIRQHDVMIISLLIKIIYMLKIQINWTKSW